MAGLGSSARGGVQGVLDELAAARQARRYRPQPVRRVDLPKPDGRPRPLGIPTGRDRVVQAASTRVGAPGFAANVRDSADGFRPQRDAGPAVRAVKAALVGGGWGLEADIQDFVDTIDPGRRVSDRRVRKRIRQGLTVGGVEEGRWQATPPGTPPGGVRSPLRAHISLHVLERWWEARHAGVGRRYRDADALVVVCRTPQQAVEAQESSGRILEWLQLTRQPDKTRVVGMADDGVDCLGCQVHKKPSRRTWRLVPYAWPSGQAMREVRAKIRPQTERCRLRVDLTALVAGLNRVIRGWRTDVRVGNSTKKLADLERYVRLRRWTCLRT